MPGTDRSLKGHPGSLLAKGFVKGTCRCEHTRWEVSAGNQVREHGNLVRGYIRENSLNEFHKLAPAVASLQCWKG